MSNELTIKKCKNCGAMIKVLKDCDCKECGIKCCGETMEVLVPNSVDAAIEKHIPTFEIDGNKVIVKVNHVMEDEHYIEWISMVSDGKECIKYLKPGEVTETKFKYIPGSKLYAYCNKHGLWVKEV